MTRETAELNSLSPKASKRRRIDGVESGDRILQLLTRCAVDDTRGLQYFHKSLGKVRAEPLQVAHDSVTHRSIPDWVPDLVAAAGPRATEAYIEFFTATIRNRNTRLAYAWAYYQFFHWARENGLTLDTVGPFHVAAYIELMPGSKPTIKQKLAALRMLYDFLVIRQLVPVNSTASVRGPKYVVKRGKTRSGAVRTYFR